MEVQFQRTGERRYAVKILRAGHPAIEMNPAPGYDPLMPHDLMHFIVERELGLRRGIFGQIAAGGDAGTFHAAPAPPEDKRAAARLRRRAARRGDKLLRAGRDNAALSERAAYICFYEWLARSNNPDRRKLAAQYFPEAKPLRGDQLTNDGDILINENLDRVRVALDAASAQWTSLAVGACFTLTWPD